MVMLMIDFPSGRVFNDDYVDDFDDDCFSLGKRF